VQASKLKLIAALAAGSAFSGLALSGCATNTNGDNVAVSTSAATPAASVAQRDLTPQEKKAIVDSVAPSLRDPGSAKYKWAKFPTIVTDQSVNYCATVDAKSPYPAYSGHQAYIVEAHMSGNRVTSSVMGLIAGGKDFAIVTNMCAKYGLDPKNSN
jgi:hypothetical protein